MNGEYDERFMTMRDVALLLTKADYFLEMTFNKSLNNKKWL